MSRYYNISIEADNDLDEIFEFTISKFGFLQAESYLIGIRDLFNTLCEDNEIGRSRNELQADLRSIPYQSHIVFYQLVSNQVMIIRVIHASRDLPKVFLI